MATEILEFLFFKLTVKLQVAERLNFHYCLVWVCVQSLTLGSQNEQISVIYFMTTPPPPLPWVPETFHARFPVSVRRLWLRV